MTTVLMIGTRKGLWLAHSEDRDSWELSGPHLDMEEVYSCLPDPATGRLYAGASSMWLGPLVRWSEDLGETWQEARIAFPDDVDASVARIWQLQRGALPGVMWAGTEPGAVFRSEDDGESWTLERALWDHPHRPQWDAGFGGQAFHTLLPHPSDPASLTAALSTGGVYQTLDGGKSWAPRNSGIRADFLPEGQQYPEFGQCVHKVARHPARPERLFAQNHGGVYRSDDEGASWRSIADGLPSDFGFPVVVHPHEPDTIYVFPLGGGAGRYPPEGKARVYRSRDAGESWEPLAQGLPDRFYVGVMRDAMTTDTEPEAGVYLGARNGTVWGSVDSGDSWRLIAADLPDVMVVRAARF
ncbi:MAG TPA: exo-alpha-sialidase [Nocardioides sp.]|uniref:exo-alpha-sialidase n=1 Tax=Nocardioides sp. TaxID=35761 RepID=UPI002EDAAADA